MRASITVVFAQIASCGFMPYRASIYTQAAVSTPALLGPSLGSLLGTRPHAPLPPFCSHRGRPGTVPARPGLYFVPCGCQTPLPGPFALPCPRPCALRPAPWPHARSPQPRQRTWALSLPSQGPSPPLPPPTPPGPVPSLESSQAVTRGLPFHGLAPCLSPGRSSGGKCPCPVISGPLLGPPPVPPLCAPPLCPWSSVYPCASRNRPAGALLGPSLGSSIGSGLSPHPGWVPSVSPHGGALLWPWLLLTPFPCVSAVDLPGLCALRAPSGKHSPAPRLGPLSARTLTPGSGRGPCVHFPAPCPPCPRPRPLAWQAAPHPNPALPKPDPSRCFPLSPRPQFLLSRRLAWGGGTGVAGRRGGVQSELGPLAWAPYRAPLRVPCAACCLLILAPPLPPLPPLPCFPLALASCSFAPGVGGCVGGSFRGWIISSVGRSVGGLGPSSSLASVHCLGSLLGSWLSPLSAPTVILGRALQSPSSRPPSLARPPVPGPCPPIAQGARAPSGRQTCPSPGPLALPGPSVPHPEPQQLAGGRPGPRAPVPPARPTPPFPFPAWPCPHSESPAPALSPWLCLP
ncbi:uncharacterized protein LOC120890003 [Ictidomys tridecemlineatus]